MKTRIIDVAELKKKPEERQAEEILGELTPGKAVEVTLTGDETPRKIARLFRNTAKRSEKEVRVTTRDKGQRVIITLK